MPWTPTPGEDQAGPGRGPVPRPGLICGEDSRGGPQGPHRGPLDDSAVPRPASAVGGELDPSEQQPLPGGG